MDSSLVGELQALFLAHHCRGRLGGTADGASGHDSDSFASSKGPCSLKWGS